MRTTFYLIFVLLSAGQATLRVEDDASAALPLDPSSQRSLRSFSSTADAKPEGNATSQDARRRLAASSSDKSKTHNRKLTVPNLFLIGAMKAGTTSLTELFRSNPAICGSGEKEKHFFSGGEYDAQYEHSIDKYIQEFSDCKYGQLTIDATPSYSSDPRVIPRMLESYDAKTLASMKFIFILREPISRHYSEYQMAVRLCVDADEDLQRGTFMQWRTYRHERSCEDVMTDFVPKFNDPAIKGSKAKVMTFHQWCLSASGRKELRRGLYKEVITRFLTLIRRDQLFLINFDTLIANASSVMTGLNDFLGIPAANRWDQKVQLPIPKKSLSRPPLAHSTHMECITVQMLEHFFKDVEGDFFSWLHHNLTSITGSYHRPKGELPFYRYTSNPYSKCLLDPSVGKWSAANYWNGTAKANTYPKATWTFVEDSVEALRKMSIAEARPHSLGR